MKQFDVGYRAGYEEAIERVREFAPELFADAVAQGLHAPFDLNCQARGHDWTGKLVDALVDD